MKKSIIMILLISSLFLSSCSEEKDEDIINDLNDVEYSATFLSDIKETLSEAESINNLYGISILVDGELIADEFFGHQEDRSRNNIFSVTKSVTSILVGIAIEEGYIDSVEQSIGDYIDLSMYDTESDLSEIKIKHLLTMSAGLIWDSNDLAGEMISLRSSPDPLSLILERELGFTPGTRFNYSDGSAHLISVILSEATGMSTRDFAVEHLFTPLGIDNLYWNEDTQGINIGGCDLYLSHVHLALIGNLVLNNGVHNGEQIVSEEWLNISTTNQISSFASHGYGYYWWLNSIQGYRIISAKGWGGQNIYILPDFDIVITTSANGIISGDIASTQFDEIDDFIVEDIIPLLINELKKD